MKLKKRKPNCQLRWLGINNGDEITCIIDNKTFYVRGNKIIVDKKTLMSLSKYMVTYHPRSTKTNEFRGTKFFTFKGRLISDLYDEFFTNNKNKENMEINKLYFFNQEDSKIFNFLNGNREVNQQHVKKLCKDLVNGDSVFFPPIIVDINTMCIADGQHRLTAYQMLWDKNKLTDNIKVIFFDYPKDVLPKVIKMNNQQKKWNTSDFAKSNIQTGDESMKLLYDFCYSCKLLFDERKKEPKYRYATALIFGKNLTKAIKEKTLSITKEDIDRGLQFYNECEEILKMINADKVGGWLEHFFGAWFDVRTDKMYEETFNKIKFSYLIEFIDFGITVNLKRDEWRKIFKDAIFEASHN